MLKVLLVCSLMVLDLVSMNIGFVVFSLWCVCI